MCAVWELNYFLESSSPTFQPSLEFSHWNNNQKLLAPWWTLFLIPHTEGTSVDWLSSDRIKCRVTSGITFQQSMIDHFTAVPMSGSLSCVFATRCVAIVAAKGGLYCARKVFNGYCDFSHSSGLGKHIFKWNWVPLQIIYRVGEMRYIIILGYTVRPACKVYVLSNENWPYKRADLISVVVKKKSVRKPVRTAVARAEVSIQKY